MKDSTRKILDELVARYPQLDGQSENVSRAFDVIAEAYRAGKKLLICGNGGSAADCEHIVGELMKSFKKKRPIDARVKAGLLAAGEDGNRLADSLEGTLRAISLASHPALSTAFNNDKDSAVTFAQQLYGYADEGDVLLAISTSGSSQNCVLAAVTARAMGVKIVALTGKTPGKLSALANAAVLVPETETYRVQELHLPVYHCLCAMLEEEFF